MELKKADVVCIVYAVDDEDTLDSGNDFKELLYNLNSVNLLWVLAFP